MQVCYCKRTYQGTYLVSSRECSIFHQSPPPPPRQPILRHPFIIPLRFVVSGRVFFLASHFFATFLLAVELQISTAGKSKCNEQPSHYSWEISLKKWFDIICCLCGKASMQPDFPPQPLAEFHILGDFSAQTRPSVRSFLLRECARWHPTHATHTGQPTHINGYTKC